MDGKDYTSEDSKSSTTSPYVAPSLSMPQSSYSTDSLGKSTTKVRQLSTDNIRSPSPSIINRPNIPGSSASQISLLNNTNSSSSGNNSNRARSHSDYVEFDLGHQDSKTGVFSSDRLTINRNDSSKARLVKEGRSNDQSILPGDENDIVAQLYKDETLKSSFQPGEYKLASGLPNISNTSNDGGNEIRKDQITEDENEEEDDEEEDDDSWNQMEAAADNELFDNKGEPIIEDDSNKHHKNHKNQLQQNQQPGEGAGSGYTRIAAEEQAEMYKEADRKTDFLFKPNKDPRKNTSSPLYGEIESDEDDFEDENLHFDAQDPLNQLHTTKRLLKDAQKFAYIGLVKLVMNEMATDLAKLALISKSYFRGSKFVKRMNLAQSSLGQWQFKISDRLYSHLELSQDEIKMIESLSAHGISPNDLAKSLKVHESVPNPAYDENATNDNQSSNNNINTNGKNDVIRPEEIATNTTIDIDVAWTVVCDLFLVLLADSVYDSRSRTLLIKFGKLLGLNELEIFQFERRITDSLQIEDASEQVWNESEILKTRKSKTKKKKLMYVGMATIGGSLVLGLSAGLLAPVIGAGIAAGLTTVGIGGTSGFLAGAGGTAFVTATGTAIGAKIGSSGMMKRVGDVKTFEFIPFHNNKRVNLIITVSGWMNSKADDVRLPFSTVDPVMGDLFSLLWEPEMLQSTGQTIGILATEALTQSIQQILGATILMALMSAVQIPMALSKLGYLLDNPWNVSLDRAWKAGLIMADTLISRNLGVRPVTLVGFSLGSRVIYSCLLELAKRGAYGLVEKVILFGSPVVVSNEELALARSVVSGDYINGYSKKDWILGYLFRATSGGLRKVAGLSPIVNFEAIQNFDCTEYVQGHMEYRKSMPQLLSQLGFQVLAEDFVEIDDPDPEQTERQRQLISEFDEARKQMEKEQMNGKKKGFWKKLFGPKKKDWWNIYEETNASGATTSIGTDDSEASGKSSGTQNFNFDVDEIMNEVDTLKIHESDKTKLGNTIKIDNETTKATLKDPKGDDKDDKDESNNDETTLYSNGGYIKKDNTNQKENYEDNDDGNDIKQENITMSFA